MKKVFDLDAAAFAYSCLRRDTYFEAILTKCVVVYNLICSTSTKLENDENKIRDNFLDYLKDVKFKEYIDLPFLVFDKEIPEKTGRADIRILPTKQKYVDDKAYYLIECKRINAVNLSGDTGLNAEYIKNGICRFVSNYYSSFFDCNAMFGFVVEAMDINQNIGHINALLPNSYTIRHGVTVNANTIQPIEYADFAEGYPYSYISKHRRTGGNELLLYHLMFDFSQIIRV